MITHTLLPGALSPSLRMMHSGPSPKLKIIYMPAAISVVCVYRASKRIKIKIKIKITNKPVAGRIGLQGKKARNKKGTLRQPTVCISFFFSFRSDLTCKPSAMYQFPSHEL